MAKRIWAMCLMGLLTGCGAGSLNELESKPVATYEFDAPMSYWATYSRIGYAVRDCFQSAGPAASWYVDQDLRSDLNRGEVAMSLTNFGKRYYVAIRVVPKGQVAGQQAMSDQTMASQAMGVETAGAQTASTTTTNQPMSHATVWISEASLQHLGPEAERWAKGDYHCDPGDRVSTTE